MTFEWTSLMVLANVVAPMLTGMSASAAVDWARERGLKLEGEKAYWTTLVVSFLVGVVTNVLVAIGSGQLVATSFSDPLLVLAVGLGGFVSAAGADRRYNFKARKKIYEAADLE